MIYVVGDIHGEITKLKNLITNIECNDKNASYIFIGDYLDKGEDVFATLNYLTELNKKKECRFLIGNHEYLWLHYEKNDELSETYLMKYGGKETLKSLHVRTMYDAKKRLLDVFSSFFDLLQPYWNNDKFVVVHSGIPPEFYKTSINEIPINKFLFNRYDFIKERKLYYHKYKIIFGHTGFYYPYVDDFKIGIDTGACFLKTQPLTAICLDENTFIDSDNNRLSLNSFSKIYCPNIIRVKSN